MKISLLFAVVLASLTPAKGITIGQLETTSTAFIALDSGASLTDELQVAACMFKGYLAGFMAGEAGALTFVVQPQEASSRQVYTPAQWMLDAPKAAASINAFIKRHKPKSVAKDSGADVMTAWFLLNCKDSDGRAKFIAHELLKDSFGPGFPDQDAIVKEVASAMADEEIAKRDPAKATEPVENRPTAPVRDARFRRIYPDGEKPSLPTK